MSEVNTPALVRSALLVNVSQLWQVASRVILTPTVIATLGLEGYGTWALVFSLCSYATALDLGVGWAYAKLTAELDELQDYSRLSAVISTGAVVVAGVAAGVLGTIWLGHSWILPVLGVPPALLADAGRALMVLSLAVLLDTSAGCARHVLAGLQRVDLQYRFIILGSVVEFATTLPLLLAGFGMVALAFGVLAGAVVSTGSAWIQCRRLRPTLVFSPFRVSTAALQQLLGLSVMFQSLPVLSSAVRQGFRLLISSLYGTAALGTFQLADRLLHVARTPAMAVITPLMPAFAKLEAGGHTDRRTWLFAGASKAVGIAAIFPLCFAMVFANSILFAWTGQHYPEAAWTVRALAPAEFATLLTGVAAVQLRAVGTVRIELAFGLVGGVLALLGLAGASPIAGYAGSVVAVTCGRTIGALWFLERFASFWKLDGWKFVRTTVLTPLSFAPICLLLGGAALSLPILSAADAGRWTVLCTLGLLGTAYGLVCAMVAWFFVMSSAERALVWQLLPATSPQARSSDSL